MEENIQPQIPPIQNDPAVIPEPKKTSPHMLYGLITALVLVILIAGGYVLFGKNKQSANEASLPTVISTTQPQEPATETVSPTPVPAVTPAVTTSNAEQTLDTTDTAMQQTISQVDTDLNNLNKINTNLDNINGL
jgi:hypothetical protein